jgi:hypothetical protein
VRSRPWPLTIQQECLLVAGIVASATLHFSLSRSMAVAIGVFNDDAVYVILGKAIATGQGYRSIHLVGTPLQSKFPPVWPALLAAFWVIGKTRLVVHVLAVVANVCANAVAAGLLWWLGRVRLAVPAALMAIAITLGFLLDPTIQYSTLLLSEPLYLLEWSAALFIVARHPDRSIVIGTLLALLALTRTQGVFVALAILVALWLDRIPRRSLVVTASVAIIPVVLWHAGLAIAAAHQTLPAEASERSYAAFVLSGSASQVIRRELAFVVDAAKAYVALIGTMLSGSRWVAWLAGLGIVSAALFGMFARWRESRAVVLSGGVTLALLVLWPAFSDRYLIGALPVVGLMAASGGAALLAPLAERWRVPIGIICVAVVGMILARQTTLRTASGGYQSPSRWLPGNSRFILELSNWARRNTAPTDRLAVSSAGGVWLYSDRQTVVTEFAESDGGRDSTFVARVIAGGRANVIVAEAPDAPVARELESLIQRCPGELEQMAGFATGQEYPRMMKVARHPCIDAVAGRRPGGGM